MTEQGLELARQARAHLTSLADFKKNCAGQAVQFRVASGNSIIEWFLIPNLGKITASLSSAHLSLRDMRTEEAIRGLRDHTLDFGILRKSAVVAPLRFHWTGYVSYSLFAPSTWVDKKRSIESLFARHPVAVSIGDEFSQRFHEACEKAKLEPNIRFTCASLTQAAELVRTRQAVALLPDMAESNLGNAVTRLDFFALAYLPSRNRHCLASTACFHSAAGRVRPCRIERHSDELLISAFCPDCLFLCCLR